MYAHIQTPPNTQPDEMAKDIIIRLPESTVSLSHYILIILTDKLIIKAMKTIVVCFNHKSDLFLNTGLLKKSFKPLSFKPKDAQVYLF